MHFSPPKLCKFFFFSGSGLVLIGETNKLNITLGVKEARYLGVNHFFHVSTM